MKGERIQVNLNTGAIDSGGATFKPVYPITDGLARGVWNDFVVHIVWSWTNGIPSVWHRTGSNRFVKKIDVAGIPTMQSLGRRRLDNYLKIGFYRNDDAEPHERPLPGRLQPRGDPDRARAGLRRRPRFPGAYRRDRAVGVRLGLADRNSASARSMCPSLQRA